MSSSSGSPVGLIAGSGLYELFDAGAPQQSLATPYGSPSAPIVRGKLGDRDVVFLPRHGRDHSVPPHRINYRANIWALRALGVRSLVTFSAVGGLSPDCPPGQFVLTDQIIDRTHGRPDTFFDGEVLSRTGVQHLSAAVPFCPRLREAAAVALTEIGEQFRPNGTVVVIQGPRFSTAAESRWFRSIGGDTVNMTQYPETFLAAELGMGVVNLSYITDSDAGINDEQSGSSAQAVQHNDVLARLKEAQPRIRASLAAIVTSLPAKYHPEGGGIAERAVAAVMEQPPIDD